MPTSTREALVAAATDLLDEGGPERVTLREVGRRSGVSHNAPYKHFTGKQDLLAAVAARELDAYAEALRAGGHDGGLSRAVAAYVARALAHPARFRLVYGPWPADVGQLGEAAERAWTSLVETVSAEQRAGRLPVTIGAVRLADLIRSTVHGAVDLELGGHLTKHEHGPASPVEVVEDLLAALRRD